MATYALTFATRAAFDTSLASGDIYNLMQGVTSSKPSVAITATITESGETFACGTNVMVDIKSVGPGDYVMYDSTNYKFFGIASKWIDNNYPAQPTQHIMIFKAGVLPARYVVCGTVIKRFGNRIRIAGDSAGLPWTSENTSDYGWNVPSLPGYEVVAKKNGTITNTYNGFEWCAFPSSRYHELYYITGNSSYLQITRAAWDAAVAAGQSTVTQNGKTVTLADYANIYDKWLTENWGPKFPSVSGCYADKDGFKNTQAIVEEFISNHGKTAASVDYAAGYCYNYTPSNSVPGLEKHSWFLGVIKDVGEIRAITHTLITPYAWKNGALSSSTAVNQYSAWGIYQVGMTYGYRKYSVLLVIPLADLILAN